MSRTDHARTHGLRAANPKRIPVRAVMRVGDFELWATRELPPTLAIRDTTTAREIRLAGETIRLMVAEERD